MKNAVDIAEALRHSGMSKFEEAQAIRSRAPSDRDMLVACLDAMRISQRNGGNTDWRHMIAALDAHLSG